MEKEDRPLAQGIGPSARALRLIFAYEGDQVRLLSEQSIDMIAPAPVVPQPGQSGFWSELRDASDHLLYASALHNPLRSVVEVHSKEPRPTITPKEVPQPKGTFVVLVPEVPEAVSIVLFGSPLGAKAGEAARELARFPLPGGPGERGTQP